MSICVVTFCVDREDFLARCIESVLAQQVVYPVRHRIFSDRVDRLRQSVRVRPYADLVVWQPLEGCEYAGHTSQKMAMLRQRALATTSEEFVCFLDDDNEHEPGHLMSLIRCIEGRNLDAAFSWRHLVYPDGAAYDGTYYPWHPDPSRAKDLHRWCVEKGMITPGSSVCRDGPVDDDDERNVSTVDMNEWLFRTSSLRRIGFDFNFTTHELANQVGEDDKLFARVRREGLSIACTGLATVRYTLGGVSNPLPRKDTATHT